MASNIPTLGYWNIRGLFFNEKLAQPSRLLLAYTETDYIDKRYNSEKTGGDIEEWLNDKNKLGLDFPNLPYLIDGDVKLTQSLTILRYLAKKHNLNGHNEQERIRIDMLEQQLKDYHQEFIRTTSDPHFENAREQYFKTFPNTLESLSKFLGDHAFFAGNNITYIDFFAYEFIDSHYYLEPELFVPYDNLKEFLLRIEELPTIHRYQYSDDYIRWPSGYVIQWYKSKYYSTFNKYIKRE